MRYPNAALGLKLMFLGQILAIAGFLLFWVPLVGFLLVLACPALELAGIYKAGADDENYRGALVFAAIILALGVVEGLLKPGLLSTLLDMGGSVLSLLLVYCVCTTTSNLLHSIGQEALSQRGNTVIKIMAGCTLVSLVCQALGFIPIINIAAALVSGIAGLVMTAGSVLYLMFLYGSCRVL